MKFKLPPSAQTATEPVTTSEPSAPERQPAKEGLGLLTVRRLPMDALEPAVYNPRTMTEKARLGLHNSIQEFGLVEPIIWNEQTGSIVGGHQRYAELREQGVVETDVVVVSLDPSKEMALNITLNNKHIQGDFVDQMLNDLVHQLEHEDEKLVKDLQLDMLKLPEWAPLEDIAKPDDEAMVEKITIKVHDTALAGEVRGELQRLLAMHWSKDQVSM